MKHISQKSYTLFLTFVAALLYALFGSHTAFQWTTTQDIPLILRLLDQNFLTNDFYTNSVVGSPRVAFSYIVYGLTRLGFGWYTILYLLKFLLMVFKPAFLFNMMYEYLKFWRQGNISARVDEAVKGVLFFGVMGLFALLQGVSGSTHPFGWGSVQGYFALSPMMTAFMLGLIYNIVALRESKIRYFSSLILLCAVFIHPVIGLCHFVVAFIFIAPSKKIKFFIGSLGFDFLIGVLTPFLVLAVFFQSSSPISASSFINIYVNLRHPHHYKISQALNITSAIWICLLLLPVHFAILLKNKQLTVLTLCSSLSLLSAPVIQFLGTEVWSVKKIAILGPSRFTMFLSIIWTLNVLIIWAYKQSKIEASIQNEVKLKKSKLINCFKEAALKFNGLLHQWDQRVQYRFFNLSLALFVVILFVFTLKHPLDNYKKGSAKPLIQWISENTSADSVFFSEKLDSFFIRVYAQRAVFADQAFPFDEAFFEEFSIRYKLYKRAKNFSVSDYACFSQLYGVDYLVLPTNRRLEMSEPIFSSDQWLLYDMKKFMSQTQCNPSRLMNHAE